MAAIFIWSSFSGFFSSVRMTSTGLHAHVHCIWCCSHDFDSQTLSFFCVQHWKIGRSQGHGFLGFTLCWSMTEYHNCNLAHLEMTQSAVLYPIIWSWSESVTSNRRNLDTIKLILSIRWTHLIIRFTGDFIYPYKSSFCAFCVASCVLNTSKISDFYKTCKQE